MADFPHAVKYLNLSPARMATLAEAENANRPFDKYYTLDKARALTKVHSEIVLKANVLVPALVHGTQVFQYNVGLPFTEDFYITRVIGNPLSNLSLIGRDDPSFTTGGCLQVKYRVGTTVTRYYLTGQRDFPGGNRAIYSPDYRNQPIKPNCVFEYWVANEIDATGLEQDLTIQMSILSDPTTADMISPSYEYEAINAAALGFSFPKSLLPPGFQQPTIVFDDN